MQPLTMSLFLVRMQARLESFPFFFFNDTATTEIYTLSLHDALPILPVGRCLVTQPQQRRTAYAHGHPLPRDRKSTRLNSSHSQISYAVFCLKKKNIMSELRHSTTSVSIPASTTRTGTCTHCHQITHC